MVTSPLPVSQTVCNGGSGADTGHGRGQYVSTGEVRLLGNGDNGADTGHGRGQYISTGEVRLLGVTWLCDSKRSEEGETVLMAICVPLASMKMIYILNNQSIWNIFSQLLQKLKKRGETLDVYTKYLYPGSSRRNHQGM